MADILATIPIPSGITEADYVAVEPKIDAVRAFARIAYQGIFIADLHRDNFLFVSSNPLVLLGHSTNEVMKGGYHFLLDNAPSEDQDAMAEVVVATFNAQHTLKLNGLFEYSISCNFHFLLNNRPVLVNHKITPLALDAKGNVWLALCLVSHSSHNSIGHITATMDNSSTGFRYSFSEHCWVKQQSKVELSPDERTMLYLTAQGFTMREIGEQMFRSLDTVKMYRKRVFTKLGVSNITEALAYATSYHLL